MTLYLRTRDNRKVVIGEVDSEEAATQRVIELDHDFELWEKMGFPPDPFPPPIGQWEGSDVYLENDEHTWLFTGFGWQEFFPVKE